MVVEIRDAHDVPPDQLLLVLTPATHAVCCLLHLRDQPRLDTHDGTGLLVKIQTGQAQGVGTDEHLVVVGVVTVLDKPTALLR